MIFYIYILSYLIFFYLHTIYLNRDYNKCIIAHHIFFCHHVCFAFLRSLWDVLLLWYNHLLCHRNQAGRVKRKDSLLLLFFFNVTFYFNVFGFYLRDAVAIEVFSRRQFWWSLCASMLVTR